MRKMKFYSNRRNARKGRRHKTGPMKSSVYKVSRGGIRL